MPIPEITLGSDLTKMKKMDLYVWQQQTLGDLFQTVEQAINELYDSCSPEVSYAEVLCNALIEAAVYEQDCRGSYAEKVAIYLQVLQYLEIQKYYDDVRRTISRDHADALFAAYMNGTLGDQKEIVEAVIGKSFQYRKPGSDEEEMVDWTVSPFLRSKVSED